MKPWVCAPALNKVGMVKQAHNPSTWEMEDNRFKTIFSYKQIQSQTDDDERRQSRPAFWIQGPQSPLSEGGNVLGSAVV